MPHSLPMRKTTGFVNPSAPSGKSQRYARPERERRFLLAHGLLSTIYLTLEEYTLLTALPATTLCKTRYSIPPFGIDAYEGPLSGLILAEIEFYDDAAMNGFIPPPWTIAEVTLDSRFTGGAFISMQSEDLAGLLSAFGVRPVSP